MSGARLTIPLPCAVIPPCSRTVRGEHERGTGVAFKNLSTESMVLVSGAWTGRDRKLLEGVAFVRPLLPAIDAAHDGLVSTQHGADLGKLPASLAANRTQAEGADQRHDHKTRGTWYLLTGLAELADDADDTRAMLDLRDRLLPKGLATTGLSYGDEAGNVTLVEKVLDAPTHTKLRQVRTWKKLTLDDEVTAWLEAGRELGTLEAERVQLEHDQDEAASTSTRSDAARARNRWIRAANALVSNLDLVTDLDPGVEQRILGQLRELEARADRRNSPRKGDAPEPAPVPAPAPVDR